MKLSALPYNFQSSNFDHVNKHFPSVDYTKTGIYKLGKDLSRTGSDGSVYSSTSRAGEDISVTGNIYSTSMNGGLVFTRLGTYEATGVCRIGPELDGDNQTALKGTTVKNDSNFTSTWLSGVVGIMYKYSASGTHGTTNSGRVKKLGLCYLNPADGKIMTYDPVHMVTGLVYGEEPEDIDKVYSSAVMLDTNSKNTVINNNYKFIGITLQHFHRHTTGNVTLTGRMWNVRPIINYSTASWDTVKNGLVVNGNASGKKIIMPHPTTTWSQYRSGDYRIYTY